MIAFKFAVKRPLLLMVLFLSMASSCAFAQTTESSDLKIKRLYDFLALGTGATTGTYYPLGNAFANVWSTRMEKVSVMAHSTRGSVDNIELLRRKELSLGIAQSDIVLSAVKGTGSFAGNSYPELRVLSALFPEVVQIVVPRDSEIETIEQLRGRKVVVGAPGSGNALTSLQLLKAAGIGADQFEPVFLSYDEAIQAMERGEFAAATIIAGVPTRVIKELHQRIGVRILSFSSNAIMDFTGKLPYLSHISIASGTYPDQKEKIETVALMALLVSNDQLSDDLAYRLLQNLFANLDYLKQIHDRAADISPDNYLKGVPDGFLHPAAASFFNDFTSGRR